MANDTNREPVYSSIIHNEYFSIPGASLRFPTAIDETSEVECYDQHAERLIHELEDAIFKLQAYRMDLASRYQALATRPTIPCVKLYRHDARYTRDGRVSYEFSAYDVYADSPCIKVNVNHTEYDGKRRREAIQAYREYIRSHPGIHAETNIDGI